MTGINKTLALVLLLMFFILAFLGGVWTGKTYFSKTVTVHDEMNQTTEESIPLHGSAETETNTTLTYQPKPYAVNQKTGERYVAPETPDIDMKLGKPELNMEINGTKVNVKKSSDEKYVFDKGQLKLTQDSVATFKVSVDPVDNTKDYGVGLGMTTDGNPAGIVTVPMSKKHHIDAWVVGDTDANVAAGAMIRF